MKALLYQTVNFSFVLKLPIYSTKLFRISRIRNGKWNFKGNFLMTVVLIIKILLQLLSYL